MKIPDILAELESRGDPNAAAGMARFGITPEKTYGVSLPTLRQMARAMGKNHSKGRELWDTHIREAMILASLIDDPKEVTEEQMEAWVLDFSYWEICDQCVSNLFSRTEMAYRKAIEWSGRDEEFVKRAGFVMMARLAVIEKTAPDRRFETLLPVIERESDDDRHNVKKAVSWALRQIGKKNQYLNKKAIRTAEEIGKRHSKGARWIASDVLRELTGEKVQQRLIRGR